MGKLTNWLSDRQLPPLRVVYGDEEVADHAGRQGGAGGDDDDPTPAEVDIISAGFRPAMRFSARLSA